MRCRISTCISLGQDRTDGFVFDYAHDHHHNASIAVAASAQIIGSGVHHDNITESLPRCRTAGTLAAVCNQRQLGWRSLLSSCPLRTAQAVGTERPCFICYKPTTTVLATINTVDFLYTCITHLSDPGFATKVAADEAKSTPAVSQEAIDKIKEEWEDSQRRRKEKEKEKEKKKDGGEDAKKDAEGEGAAAKKTKSPPPPAPAISTPGSSASTTPVTPNHEKYVLHRDMFALRQAEHRRRRQANQAKDLAPRLPAAPKTSIQ